MIGNLNQLSFQSFGSIESERVAPKSPAHRRAPGQVLELSPGEASVYCCETEIWVCNHANMTVLSVSKDGEQFQHFYLDKMVCIRPGTHFALRPYQETSKV